MRLRHLFFLTALVVCSNANALSITESLWQKPVPNKGTFDYETELYLYNSNMKGFFVGANEYTTRASIGDEGYKVYVYKHLEDGSWDGKTIILKDYVETKSAIYMVFFESSETATGGANIWVDQASQTDTLWTINSQGNEIYRFTPGDGNLSVNPTNFPDCYVGAETSEEDTRLYLFSSSSSGIDWYFVTPADYESYLESLQAYNTANELYTVIVEASNSGVSDSDLNTYVAVYNNTSSTYEDLQTAIDAVKNLINALDEKQVTADNPSDKTIFLTNPDYQIGDASTGWTQTDGSVAYGYYCGEFYEETFDYNQTLTDMPNGVYSVQVQGFMRPGNTSNSYDYWLSGTGITAYLYGTSAGDTFKTKLLNIFDGSSDAMVGVGTETSAGSDPVLYVPNTMQAANAYFEEGRYTDNKCFFGIDNNELTIGLIDESYNSGDWTIFSNWTLTYYGTGTDAYALWLKQVIADAPNYDNLGDDVIVSTYLVTEYNSMLSNLSATNKAEVMAIIENIDTASVVIDENIDAWSTYTSLVSKAKQVVGNDLFTGDDVSELSDYIDFDYEEFIKSVENKTTSEVIAETEKLEALYDLAMLNGLSEGTDVTSLWITNPDFEDGDTGWTGTYTNIDGTSDNKMIECWNMAFDVYQVVKSAPQGVYAISMQGFYRPGNNSEAYSAYANNTLGASTIGVYMNDNKTMLPCVYDEKVQTGELYTTDTDLLVTENEPYDPEDGYWYPNEMYNAGLAFNEGMYQASAYGLVLNKGDELRIGVKGELDNQYQWALWDNFKLTYWGFNADILKTTLEEALNDAKALTGETMGVDIAELLSSAITAGSEALENNDGEVMFNAVAALYIAKDSATESIALFQTLINSYNDIQEVYLNAEAAQSTMTECATLLEKISEGLNTTIKNEDVAGLLEELAAMRTKLNIPQGEASDASPLDYTTVIYNPGYEVEGANSVDGWTYTTGYNFGNSDEQKAALLLEYYNTVFDIYQEIVGLPEGTYQVGVSAFYRMGSTSDDASAYEEGTENENCYLYAIGSDKHYSTPVSLLAAAAKTESLSASGSTECTLNGETMYVPNDMVSAKAWFDDGNYYNSLIVKVDSDGELTIGLRKYENITSDWVIFDDWKLYYYGSSSTQEDSNDADGIENVNANTQGITVFYNINGSVSKAPQKGVNIMKVTYPNGTVTVKKVIVK